MVEGVRRASYVIVNERCRALTRRRQERRSDLTTEPDPDGMHSRAIPQKPRMGQIMHQKRAEVTPNPRFYRFEASENGSYDRAGRYDAGMNSLAHIPCLSQFLLLIACAGVALPGCTAPQYDRWPADAGLSHAHSPGEVEHVRDLPAFSGRDGTALSWSEMHDALDWAAIIIIGEQHDDAVGHDVQRAIAEDVLARWGESRISMEMLTRDHQIFVDDYLDGIISAERFVRLAGVRDWGGKGMWHEWYQPIIDVAKEHEARVIAANAPRRYVRLARTQGYGSLRALPRERRALFDLPRDHTGSDYHSRFFEVMHTMAAGPEDDDDENDDENDGANENVESDAAAHHHMDHSQLDAMFRSQLVWDATMARSIVSARPRRDAKVIHLCGRFHSDYEGGTVLEIRRLLPMARVITISMVRAEATSLRDEDKNRADIVIYTGEPEEAGAEEEDVHDEGGAAARPRRLRKASHMSPGAVGRSTRMRRLFVVSALRSES